MVEPKIEVGDIIKLKVDSKYRLLEGVVTEIDGTTIWLGEQRDRTFTIGSRFHTEMIVVIKCELGRAIYGKEITKS